MTRTAALAPFSMAAIPQLIQGAGTLKRLPDWLVGGGERDIAVCTGSSSFSRNPRSREFFQKLERLGVRVHRYAVSGEPDPASLDTLVRQAAAARVTCVVGIGGGSVIDTAKAAAAMVPLAVRELEGGAEYPGVSSFLEGVGTLSPPSARLRLAAVPTTAGTGSEATKNAVITQIGPEGFKKSLRHDCYVPDLALIDGELALGTPREVTVSSGLDAVTQLLESFVSPAGSIITDSLARTGLSLAAEAFPALCEDGSDLRAREKMALAAYLSGITLANANLGVIHGASSALGAARPIPHGTACGTLLFSATAVIVRRLNTAARDGDMEAAAALDKYAQAGMLLNLDKKGYGTEDGAELLLDILHSWQEQLGLPRLGTFGFTAGELKELAQSTDLKKTPITLTPTEIGEIFTVRL
jgi:alcohol dehydrogenase class IV